MTCQPSRAAATPDAQLVQLASAGDFGAWSELVERHAAFLYRIARSYDLDEATSADIVQTAWIRLAKGLPTLRARGAVGAWLATTVREQSRSVLRSYQREHRASPNDMDAADPRPLPEEQAASADRDARLQVALDRLPGRDRRLLLLLTAAPPPTDAELSAALDVPVGSVGRKRARSLARLRRELSAMGVDPLPATPDAARTSGRSCVTCPASPHT
jgi:RNA polymerase sigma factor (sigma-70 family)